MARSDVAGLCVLVLRHSRTAIVELIFLDLPGQCSIRSRTSTQKDIQLLDKADRHATAPEARLQKCVFRVRSQRTRHLGGRLLLLGPASSDGTIVLNTIPASERSRDMDNGRWRRCQDRCLSTATCELTAISAMHGAQRRSPGGYGDLQVQVVWQVT